MSEFMKLLNLILSFGPRIPQIMEKIEHIINEVRELVDLVNPGLFTAAAVVALTEEEAEAEGKILAACPSMSASENFAGPFATIFAFIKAHPELIAILLKLLAKPA